jgi:FKBP-type peptidyl-prolyl cis-trans isomerase FklB
MKKIFLFGFAFLAISQINAQNKLAGKKTAKPAEPSVDVVTTAVPNIKIGKALATTPLKSGLDSFSYAAGLSIGESLKQAGVTKVNSVLFTKALNEILGNGKTLLDKDQAQFILQTKLQEYAKNRPAQKKVITPYMKECQSYMDVNKKKPGVTTLPNGLQYEVINAGEPNGAKPGLQDQVSVNYMGTLINGTEFDNSYKRGQPATFPLTGVIRGWTEILQLMPKGAKWKVTIPSEMAYGENPPSSQIPPSATLIFDIELLDIIKPGGTAPAQIVEPK